MPTTNVTKFEISKRPGPLGLMVETTSFNIYSHGDKWKAEENVTYMDNSVDVTIVIRGQLGQEYELSMTLNSVKKEIKGKLKKSGINRITRSFKISSFNL